MSRTGYRHRGREQQLTERQEQVLALIAKGRTNPEIAGELGISLDGAKWHVTEILARLNVSTREEAAAYWRDRTSPSRRAVRGLRLLVGASALRWAAGVLGVAAMALVVALFTLRGDEPTPAAVEPTPAVSPGASRTPVAASPTPGAVEACPVDPAICAFADEKVAQLLANDLTTFLTPSPWQRSGDTSSIKDWLDETLPRFPGWQPEVVSIGCPFYGDPPGASCDEAFALAFSTLEQAEPGEPGGLGELLYRRHSLDEATRGVPELRSMTRPSAADRSVILNGGVTVSARMFQSRDVLPEAVRVAWYPIGGAPPVLPFEPREVVGLSREPAARPAYLSATVETGTSSFPTYEGGVAIYDTLTGRAITPGQGQLPRFSPDSRRAAYVAAGTGGVGDVTLVDLESGATSVVGRGRSVLWIDSRVLAIAGAGDGAEDGNTWALYDVETGVTTPVAAPADDLFPVFPVRRVPYEIRAIEQIGQPLPRGGNSLARWLIARDGVPVFQLEAFRVVPQTETSVIVATEPDPATLQSNLFSVDLDTGEATFLVTAVASSPNWPLSAFGSLVMWTDRYCPVVDDQANVLAPAGDTWLFNAATGSLTQLNPRGLPYPTLVSERQFSLGEFGASALISTRTFTPEVILPVAALSWSADYRYAATGDSVGHGGLC